MTVEKLVYGGDGLARLDGRVVLAPFVLPGERIRARARQRKAGADAGATRWKCWRPAPERVAAPCPYFGRCGGCHYQHAPYEYQLPLKRRILEEELRRLGKIEPPGEIAVIAGEPWGYRNRVQLHVEDGRLGYREARSHKLCAIDQCPIARPRSTRRSRPGAHDRRPALAAVRAVARTFHRRARRCSSMCSRRIGRWRGASSSGAAEEIPGLVAGALDYDGHFRVSGSSFFQVNRFLIDRLVEAAAEGAEGETAFDLYAGVGLFSLPLARRFREVTAVESGGGAVRDLQFNAERAGLSQRAGGAAHGGGILEALERAPDFVLLDPPRAGLGKAVVRRLAELQPRR